MLPLNIGLILVKALRSPKYCLVNSHKVMIIREMKESYFQARRHETEDPKVRIPVPEKRFFLMKPQLKCKKITLL